MTLSSLTAIPQGLAQNFRLKPIRIVVPSAPGGPNDILDRIPRTPEIAERLQQEKTEPVGGSPEQFGKLFRSSIGRWGKVIKDAGIRVD